MRALIALSLLAGVTSLHAQEISRVQAVDNRICLPEQMIDIVRCGSYTMIGCEARGEGKNYICEGGMPKQAGASVKVVEKKVFVTSPRKVIVIHDGHKPIAHHRYSPRVRSIFDLLLHHGK